MGKNESKLGVSVNVRAACIALGLCGVAASVLGCSSSDGPTVHEQCEAYQLSAYPPGRDRDVSVPAQFCCLVYHRFRRCRVSGPRDRAGRQMGFNGARKQLSDGSIGATSHRRILEP